MLPADRKGHLVICEFLLCKASSCCDWHAVCKGRLRAITNSIQLHLIRLESLILANMAAVFEDVDPSLQKWFASMAGVGCFRCLRVATPPHVVCKNALSAHPICVWVLATAWVCCPERHLVSWTGVAGDAMALQSQAKLGLQALSLRHTPYLSIQKCCLRSSLNWDGRVKTEVPSHHLTWNLTGGSWQTIFLFKDPLC